ncbi:hypothetical protein GCM10009743_29400 [Kribbella swartbergensis]
MGVAWGPLVEVLLGFASALAVETDHAFQVGIDGEIVAAGIGHTGREAGAGVIVGGASVVEPGTAAYAELPHHRAAAVDVDDLHIDQAMSVDQGIQIGRHRTHRRLYRAPARDPS